MTRLGPETDGSGTGQRDKVAWDGGGWEERRNSFFALIILIGYTVISSCC